MVSEGEYSLENNVPLGDKPKGDVPHCTTRVTDTPMLPAHPTQTPMQTDAYHNSSCRLMLTYIPVLKVTSTDPSASLQEKEAVSTHSKQGRPSHFFVINRHQETCTRQHIHNTQTDQLHAAQGVACTQR